MKTMKRMSYLELEDHARKLELHILKITKFENPRRKKKMKSIEEKENAEYTTIDPLKFDPDELKLTKKDILELMNGIENRWKKNKKANTQFIMSMEAMKIGIRLTSEQTVSQIWYEIVNGFNELLYENAIAKANGENETWSQTLEKVKRKLKS